MSLIIPANSAAASGGYEVANSCRFNDDDAADLTRSKGASETSLKKGTFSFWIKRAGIEQTMIYSNTVENDNNRAFIQLNSDHKLRIHDNDTSGDNLAIITTQVFRDPSAWSNFVIAFDTTQGTAANRVKIYYNGTQITAFDTETYPAQDIDLKIFEGGQTNKEVIGGINGGTSDAEFYLAEFVFIDGTQNAVTDFGEFDEDSGIWKPIDVSGLTFGTNGFYLDFEDSAALGDDVSGNGNDFTVNNLTAIDQSTDTCTNNFATMNALDNYYAGATFSEGNLKFVHGVSAWTYNTATFGLSSGKWYWEMKCVDAGTSGTGLQPSVGIANRPSTSSGNYLGQDAYAWGYRSYQQNVINNGSQVLGSLSTFTDGDIIGVYMDLDNNKLYFSKNGTLENSTGISLTAPASTTTGFYFPAAGDNKDNASTTWEANFGSPSFSISSGNTDDNGYGNFEYSPTITGDSVSKDFYAINTKNLSEFG